VLLGQQTADISLSIT